MIEHIVLFKVKAATPAEDSERMLQRLKSLAGKIPEIRELSCGANFSDRNQGFTHGLFARFLSQADLEVYVAHPEHQRVVAECVRPIVDSVIVVDYEK